MVQPGDYLSSIAETFYDDQNLWPVLYAVNEDVIGANPSLLRSGMVLRIPADPDAFAAETAAFLERRAAAQEAAAQQAEESEDPSEEEQ